MTKREAYGAGELTLARGHAKLLSGRGTSGGGQYRSMRDLTGFNVEESPRYRLAALSRRWSTAVEKEYVRDFGLSLSEWRIVAIVGTEGPINAGAIADRGLLEKSHVSKLVSRLLTRGLVESRADPEDARKSWLSLTDEGQAVFRRVADMSLQRDQEFLMPLTERERATFVRLISKLELWSDETLDL